MEIHKPVRDLSVSDIEKGAKQAVVDAVEARWKRQDQLNRHLARRATLRSVLSVLLLLILCGGVFWYLVESGIVQKPQVIETVQEKLSPAPSFQKRYLDLSATFREKEPLGPWTSAPASLRPKNASVGTIYHALVARQPVGYDLYEIIVEAKGKLSYYILSPIAEPVRVTAADFKVASSAGYLIEREGAVYICGKMTDASVQKLQKRL